MADALPTTRAVRGLSLLLVAITFVTYLPLFQCGFINFDDPDYVTANPHVSQGLHVSAVRWAFGAAYAGNWHPLTWISHMSDVELFGLNPMGHHLVNLGFHIANSVLLFCLFARMTRVIWPSFFVAALFALHPLHVESVAWISERKDVLSAFFFILTIWAYTMRSLPGPGNRWSLPYFLSLLFFALGLMCKPMLVTVPFVLLLLDYWPLGRFGAGRADSRKEDQSPGRQDVKIPLRALILEKVPFLVLTVSTCIITFWTQRAQGAVAPRGLPIDSRIANAILSCGSYVWNMFWPVNLAIFYPHPATKHPELMEWISWKVALSAVVLAMLSFFAVRQARKRPFLLFGWGWYLITLAPVIGIVQVGAQARADRYTYIPLIGLFVAIIWLIAEFVETYPRRSGWVSLTAACAVCACGALSFRQAGFWKNSVTLFQHAMAVTRDNATAHFNLGAALEAGGDLSGAMEHYRESLRIDPTADAHYNLGHGLAAQGDWQPAIEEYEAALKLNPSYVLAENNLGLIYHTTGKFELAELHYRNAVRLQPDYAQGYYNLGKLSLDRGEFKNAEADYSQALKIKPDYHQAEAGLGLALAAQGKPDEALPFLQRTALVLSHSAGAQLAVANVLTDAGRTQDARKYLDFALALDPNLPQKKLAEANSLIAQSEPIPALARLTEVIRLEPGNAGAFLQIGLLLGQQGKTQEALTNFLQAVRLRPDAQSHYYAALAYAALKRHEQAIFHYKQALTFRPDWPEALNDLAWILATSPQAELRDGSEAVRLARSACKIAGESEPRFMGTLDAACAEAGLFDEAISTARKTKALAEAAGNTVIADAASQRLQLYQNHQPYRQP